MPNPIRKFNGWLKSYFTYTSSERNGFLALSILLLSLIVTQKLMPIWVKNVPQDVSQFEAEIAAFEKERNETFQSKSRDRSYRKDRTVYKDTVFYFDPNKISYEEWRMLGIKGKTANIISNYLEKGGRFDEKEDLLKIYGFLQDDYNRLRDFIAIRNETRPAKGIQLTGKEFYFDPNDLPLESWKELGIPESTANTIHNFLAAGAHFREKEDLLKVYGFKKYHFERLAPFILIDTTNLPDESAGFDFSHYAENETEGSVEGGALPPLEGISAAGETTTSILVDINLADADAFQQLPGIDSRLANRIVKFRDKLGGFVALDQFAEVYGIEDTVYQTLKNNLSMTPMDIPKINVAYATVEELQAHPYISPYAAKTIVGYRTHTKKLHVLSEIKKAYGVNDSIYQKILPYIELDYDKTEE